MRSTKILVFRAKQILYTALFIILGILLIIFLIMMFSDKKPKETAGGLSFVPGVYTASAIIDNQPICVEVLVDKDHINSVNIVNLDTSLQALYPLLEPAMEDLQTQIISGEVSDPIHINPDYRYTSTFLLDIINKALAKAQ